MEGGEGDVRGVRKEENSEGKIKSPFERKEGEEVRESVGDGESPNPTVHPLLYDVEYLAVGVI